MKQTLQNIIESDDMQYSLAFMLLAFAIFLILAGYLYILTKKESAKPTQTNNDHEVIFVIGPPESGKTPLIKYLLGIAKLHKIERTTNDSYIADYTLYTYLEGTFRDLFLDFETTAKVNLGALNKWAFSPIIYKKNPEESIRRVFIELSQSDFNALQLVSMQSHHIDKVYFTHCMQHCAFSNETDILYSVYNMASSQLSPIETITIKHKK